MSGHAADPGRTARETGRGERAGPADPTDRGSATVWAAGLIVVVLLIGTVGIDLVSAVRARHVAGSAADLAALAAAGVSSDGEQRACATARESAESNGATVRECRLEGWDALIRVEVERGWTWVGRGPASAAARAGPAPPEPSEHTADTRTPVPREAKGR
ncbi:Rv3654c family TadE-like protein [Pseudonocardia endophytica]|uniref:Secretion/DNA translocation related TadE-like protein n=1 Tax=Pseudonocardia endophytica TaxID=401976 RepID=A0A4V2PJ48_PSEEN|nr:Rv3654c family TadE-like protein [Pseudonocardia endophytica]TCK27106.1 secretion/DNA translocation related TadE-like protein [Pseudonocardia endophytica]